MTASIENQIAQANAAFVAPAVATVVPPVAAPVADAPTPAAEPAVPLTRAQTLQKGIDAESAKITTAQKRLDLLTAQLANIDKIESIKPGSLVTVQLGRADTLRTVDGVVSGIKVEDNGDKKFKILVGSGFDASIETVGEGQIVSVKA